MRDVDTRPRAGKPPGRARRKKRRHGNRTLYYILFTLILFAAAVTLSLTVLFKIESVTAAGVDRHSLEEIALSSGIKPGENLFRADYKAAEENILKLYPYVESVDIRLRPPGGVHIELTQCVPAAALLEGDNYVMITREGKLLERGLLYIPEGIPLVSGIETGGAAPGDTLGEEAEESLVMLEYLFEAVEQTGFQMPTNVDITDVYNMTIIHENRLLLNLGTESELAAKLNFVKNMIDEQLPPDAQGRIDAGDIGDQVIYVEMPIADARRGERRGTAAQPAPETPFATPATAGTA